MFIIYLPFFLTDACNQRTCPPSLWYKENYYISYFRRYLFSWLIYWSSYFVHFTSIKFSSSWLVLLTEEFLMQDLAKLGYHRFLYFDEFWWAYVNGYWSWFVIMMQMGWGCWSSSLLIDITLFLILFFARLGTNYNMYSKKSTCPVDIVEWVSVTSHEDFVFGFRNFVLRHVYN